MVDKKKIEILKLIDQANNSNSLEDFDSLAKKGFNSGFLKAMKSEGLVFWGGAHEFHLTKEGEKILGENIIIEKLNSQQEKTTAMTDAISNQYKFIQNSLENTLKATKIMRDWTNSARILSFPGENTRKMILPLIEKIQGQSKMFTEIARTQEWASKLGGLINLSQLSRLASAIPKIPVLNMPLEKVTLPIINESKKELIFLSQTLDNERDSVYNIEAYEVLFNLEIMLRRLINERIILKFPKQLNQKLPPNMLTDWEERKTEEEDNHYTDDVEYNLIDFSDFTDLKKIFEKGQNRKLFYDLISEEDFRVITSKLHELEPIRIKIAHARLLTEKEFTTLKLHYDQIIKLFAKSD